MRPLTIEFRAKPEKIWYGETPRLRVKVPEFNTRHCDMDAFRCSRRFGSYANSVLFIPLLKRATDAIGLKSHIWADEPMPDGVEIDQTGFLWLVRITLQEAAK